MDYRPFSLDNLVHSSRYPLSLLKWRGVLLGDCRSNDLPSFGGAVSRLQGWLPQARQESTASDEVYEHFFSYFVSSLSDICFSAGWGSEISFFRNFLIWISFRVSFAQLYVWYATWCFRLCLRSDVVCTVICFGKDFCLYFVSLFYHLYWLCVCLDTLSSNETSKLQLDLFSNEHSPSMQTRFPGRGQVLGKFGCPANPAC